MKSNQKEQIKTQLFGGYNREQVDYLLEKLNNQIEYLQQRNDDLTSKVQRLSDQEIHAITADELRYQDLTLCDLDVLVSIAREISYEVLLHALADQAQPDINHALYRSVIRSIYEELKEDLATMDSQFLNDQHIKSAQEEILAAMKRLCRRKEIYIYR